MDPVKPKGKVFVRFELGIFGLFSLTVVAGCLLLWMFLLGVWAGQTVLNSGEGKLIMNQPVDPAAETAEQTPEPVAAVTQKKAAAPPSPEPEAVEIPANAEWETAAPAVPESETPSGGSPGRVEKSASETAPPAAGNAKPAETSYFSLQVAAFRDAERAKSDAAHWRGRGHETFVVPPTDGEDPFTRVYIGRFNSAIEANRFFAKMEKEEKVKGYIALLPASKLQKR